MEPCPPGYISCSQCGFMMTIKDANESACLRCHGKGLGDKVKPQLATQDILHNNSGLECPCCHNSETQDVTTISASGQWSGQSTGTHGGYMFGNASQGGHFYAGVSSYQNSGQTELSRLLQAPPYPEYKSDNAERGSEVYLVGCLSSLTSFGAAGLFMLLIFFFPIFWLLGWSGAMWEFVKVGFGIGIIGLILMVLVVQPYLQREKLRIADLQRTYKRAYPIWRRLRFCPRCSSVYDPVTGYHRSGESAWSAACNVSEGFI